MPEPSGPDWQLTFDMIAMYIAELEAKLMSMGIDPHVDGWKDKPPVWPPVEPPPVDPPPVDPPPVDPPPVVGFSKILEPPAGRMLLGTSLPSGSLTMFKVATGGTLPHIGHDYATSGASFKSRLADAEVRGTIPLINFKPGGQNGPAEYRTILAGGRDAAIRDAAAAAKAYGKPFFFAPLHEPENDDASGGGDAEYAKAFRYVCDMMHAQGATNAVRVWNMMGFDQHIPRYTKLYPGNDAVDWIGGDPYSHSTAKTLALLGKKFYDAMKFTGKPMMWCEWGYDKPTITAKPALVSPTELDKMQQAMPLLRALVYWNQWKDQSAGDGKNYLISNFSAQFGKFAASPQFAFTLPTSLAA